MTGIARSARRGTPAARACPRVVLDTNIVLSALVFARPASARLRGLWQHGAFMPLISADTTRELMRVLAYAKFKLDADEQRELLADYLPWAETVIVPEPPPRVPRCRDPHDLPFLHLAVAGQADALVSGDADLLAITEPLLAGRRQTPIITLDAFLNAYPTP